MTLRRKQAIDLWLNTPKLSTKPEKYNKEIQLFMWGGYLAFYDLEHPLSNSTGIILYHRHVMSVCLNRWLSANEQVHHKNEIKTDNRVENLEVLSAKDHMSRHMHERHGTNLCRIGYCRSCKKVFAFNTRKHTYCSETCSFLGRRVVDRPGKEELEKLVWEMPTTKIAIKFGVSDKAIDKWCKNYEIKKPTTGYWAKKAAGKL